jgi:hypothetical protein
MARNGIMSPACHGAFGGAAVRRQHDDTTTRRHDAVLAPQAPGTKKHEALEEHEDNWPR